MNSTAGTMVCLRHVSMKFGGATALHELAWDVMPGEVHCLMGENGSGKSTTIKILSGIHQPQAGAEIYIAGQRVESLSPALAKSLGIQVIYQDLSLFPNLSVAENIAFDEVCAAWMKPISRQRQHAIAQSVMGRLGVSLPLHALIGSLPIASRQLVAICRGMAAKARILFMDEPTASLTRAEVEALLNVVRKLKSDGVAVVFVSHKLDEVVEIAERVTVLRDGRKLGTWSASELNDKRLASIMTGLDIEHQVRAQNKSKARTMLQVQHLCRRGEYQDLSFHIRAGEILGLVGLLATCRTSPAISDNHRLGI